MEALEIKKAKATARTIRISAQKARLVIDLIRGKKVSEAEAILINKNKEASRVIMKVLKSAASNAEHNLGLDKEKLYISEAYINDGPVLKRIKFGSRSHIDRNDHRTSHITIVVSELN